jgi:hypothetical protein
MNDKEMEEERNVSITKNSNPAIPNGVHLLTGVDEFRIETEWDHIDGWAIILDGKTYIAYYDPDDGYRSYAGFREATDEECKSINIINRFPPQEVFSTAYRERIEEDGWCQVDAEKFRLLNFCGGIVLEVSTDYSEDYYPRGHVEYNPENLPINK